MTSFRILSFVALCSCFIASHQVASSDEPIGEKVQDVEAGEIRVHMKGRISIQARTQNRNARPQDDAEWELVNATVTAGGETIGLDWNGSKAIRDELMWWRIPRHGDIREVHAEVTGVLTFKTSEEFPGIRLASDKTPIPVVRVESLKIQLVHPGGGPSDQPFDRGVVRAESGREKKNRVP